MGGTGVVGDTTLLGAAHMSEAVVDLDSLAGLFRTRAETHIPVRQRDLPPLERTLRKHVAESLLTHVMPALVRELLEAVGDDLHRGARRGSVGPRGRGRRGAEGRRVGRALQGGAGRRRPGGAGAAALDHRVERAGALRRARAREAAGLDRRRRADGDGGLARQRGSARHDVRARLALATARTPGAAELRGRLQRGAGQSHRACTIHAEIATLPVECGPSRRRRRSGPRTVRPRPPLSSVSDSPAPAWQPTARPPSADAGPGAPPWCSRADRPRRARGAQLVNDADKIIAAMERVDAIARAARQGRRPPRPRLAARRRHHRHPHVRLARERRRPVRLRARRPGATTYPGGSVSGSPVSGAGRPPASRIVVPFTTAVGLTDAPCEVPGHGWVTADHARRDHAQRRLDVAPPRSSMPTPGPPCTSRPAPTGRLRRCAPTSRPSTARVARRAAPCRPPGATSTTTSRGRTARPRSANLTSKHRPHHNLHTHGHWLVRRDGDRVRWRTKAGSHLRHPSEGLARGGPRPTRARPPPRPLRRGEDSRGRTAAFLSSVPAPDGTTARSGRRRERFGEPEDTVGRREVEAEQVDHVVGTAVDGQLVPCPVDVVRQRCHAVGRGR